MFKFLQSPVQKTPLSPTLFEGSSNRLSYQRYSSVDQCYSKPDSSLNSSRLDMTKQDKKYQTGQKTQRSDKQRVHSQKKLTLTSALPPNGSFNNTLGQTQNVGLISAKQAYEGFKKNLQLKTMNLNKNAPLEKKGKFTSTKGNQNIKFPTSTTSIRLDSTSLIQEKENELDRVSQYTPFQKERNNTLIQANDVNYYASNPQNFYRPQTTQTAPNSPVYKTFSKGVNLQSKLPVYSSSKSNQSQDVMQFCHQKIAQLKEQTNLVLMQNSKKIKELEGLLLHNKQQLDAKDQIIRELEVNLVLKENTQTLSMPAINSSGCFRMQNTLIDNQRNQSNDYLNSRINDLGKKIEVLSTWSTQNQQRINEKIDKMNHFMESFIGVKFHNLKFILKTFVTKTEQKVESVVDKISRVQSILKFNEIEAYEHLLQKAKQFTHSIEKIVEIKVPEKVQFEDMRTTINTTVESFKHRPSQSNYQTMIESTQINESFWNNLEDVSLPQNKHQQQPSFTDDSFSYAPGSAKGFNFGSNNNSSVNEFALGSFPSFSKFSGDVNFCKESLNSIKSSFTEVAPSNQPSLCIKTIEEIAKYRQGPVSVYLDSNGSLRYKGSESYIFDRKGNILKPSKEEFEFCLSRRWISTV